MALTIRIAFWSLNKKLTTTSTVPVIPMISCSMPSPHIDCRGLRSPGKTMVLCFLLCPFPTEIDERGIQQSANGFYDTGAQRNRQACLGIIEAKESRKDEDEVFQTVAQDGGHIVPQPQIFRGTLPELLEDVNVRKVGQEEANDADRGCPDREGQDSIQRLGYKVEIVGLVGVYKQPKRYEHDSGNEAHEYGFLRRFMPIRFRQNIRGKVGAGKHDISQSYTDSEHVYLLCDSDVRKDGANTNPRKQSDLAEQLCNQRYAEICQHPRPDQQ